MAPNQTGSQQSDIDTLKRVLVVHREWLSERNIGTQALQGIPLAKVKQMAAEAKALDASRMSKWSQKTIRVGYCLLAVQSTQVMNDIGEMLIKRMMSIHKKGKQSLDKYRLQKQTEGSAEERVSSFEKVIEDREDAVLEDCETYLALAAITNPFLW